MSRSLRLLTVGYFVVLGLVLVAVLPFAIFTAYEVDQRTSQLLPAQQHAQALLTAAIDQETGERGFVITGDRTFLEPYETGRRRASAEITALHALRLHDDERATLATAATALGTWQRSAAEPEISAASVGDTSRARVLIASGEGRRLFDRFRTAHDRLVALVQTRLRTSNEAVVRYSQIVIGALIGAALLGIGIALTFRAAARRVIVQQERDAAALTEAEALLRAVVEATSDPIFAKDTSGRYELANSAAATALGSTPDAVLGKTVGELTGPGTGSGISEDDLEVFATGVEHSFDETLETPDGQREFFVRKAPLRNDAGEVTGLVGVARDVTEERAVARELAAAAQVRGASANVMAALAGARTVEEVGRAALESLAPSVAASAATLTVRDPDSGEWSVLSRYGRGDGAARVVEVDDEPRNAGSLDVTVHYLDAEVARLSVEVASADPVPIALARDTVDAIGPAVAQALERARLFEAQQESAATLQRAMLGRVDRGDERLTVATHYRPAEHDLFVGGDWYDVVAMSDGRVALVVGDAVGHGIGAATAMGQLRSALRALVGAVEDLSEVLAQLEGFARETPGAMCATCLVVVIDPARESIRFVSAGHPPPVIVSPDGRATFLDAVHGPPLASGLLDRRRAIGEHPLPVGSTLLLYTDGLIERRGESLDLGLARLLRTAARGLEVEPEQLGDDVLSEMLPDGGNADDVALVVARLDRTHSRDFTRRVRNDYSDLSPTRHALARWLGQWDLPPEWSDGVLVGIGEAVANSLEHAYPQGADGVVVLEANRADDLVTLRVRDQGHWRPPQADPTRGRGFQLMRALADDVVVSQEANGTTVTLVYRVPEPADE